MGRDQGSGRAESPEREGEDYLKRILETAPVGIAVVRGRLIQSVNDGLCALTGYDREDLVDQGTRRFFQSDEDYERAGRILYGPSDGTVPMIESRILRKDATFLDVLVRVAPFADGVQDERAFTVVVMDIGERKRAEHALESRLRAVTSPETADEAAPRLDALFDLEEIQKIQDAFSVATGVASIITDTAGVPLTRPSNFTRLCRDVIRGTGKGCANCRRSDAALGRVNPVGPLMGPCLSGGLWDGGAAISAGDRHIANWLIGQVVDESVDLAQVRAYAAEIGVDQAAFDVALAEVPRMSKERFGKICEALFLIARQLSMLAYGNLQQARAIVERRRTAEEKDALYRELKHRVKNGMALIAALVDLEAGRSKNGDTRAALASTRVRIESLASLYDALGGSDDPTEIRLDAYLSRIVGVAEATFGEAAANVDFRCDFVPMVTKARSAAPLALILMELLTNAIKYAFPAGKGGAVTLDLALEADGGIRFSVADDGVGFPAGFDPKASAGLGMELIGMLVAQLSGDLALGTGTGARIDIRLPAGSGRPADAPGPRPERF